MPWQIEITQELQSPGKRWTKKERCSVDGWTITLQTKEEADRIGAMLTPPYDQPYMLQQHEFDRPHANAIESGLSSDIKNIADVVLLLGQQDYYTLDGHPKRWNPETEDYE